MWTGSSCEQEIGFERSVHRADHQHKPTQALFTDAAPNHSRIFEYSTRNVQLPVSVHKDFKHLFLIKMNRSYKTLQQNIYFSFFFLKLTLLPPLFSLVYPQYQTFLTSIYFSVLIQKANLCTQVATSINLIVYNFLLQFCSPLVL